MANAGQEIARQILDELAQCGVKLIASLPDNWVMDVIAAAALDPRFCHVPVNREESAVGLCAGAYMGAMGSAALMGASGFMTVIYAITQADFVVIPTQGSQLDANEASRAIRVVMQSQKLKKAAVPYVVLLTRTSPSIRTRGLAHIQKGMIEAGIPVLKTELNERDAFKAVFSFQQTLDQLNPDEVPNLDKAKLNVWELAHEILERLKSEQGRGQGEDQTTNIAGAA